jgi:hypothetical protein
MLNVFGQKLESLNNSHHVSPEVKFKSFMFLAVSKVTKYVPTTAVVRTHIVTCLTAKNMNMFTFSDAQYAKFFTITRAQRKSYIKPKRLFGII